MCWTTKIMENTTPITADEDIKVVKILEVNSLGEMYSPYMYMAYHYDVAFPVEKLIPYHQTHCNISSWYINEGYHSFADCRIQLKEMDLSGYYQYSNNNDGSVMYDWLEGNERIIPFECIIPKGTQYYLNEDNEIVSETIILKKPHDFEIAPDLIENEYCKMLMNLVDKMKEFAGEKNNQSKK